MLNPSRLSRSPSPLSLPSPAHSPVRNPIKLTLKCSGAENPAPQAPATGQPRRSGLRLPKSEARRLFGLLLESQQELDKTKSLMGIPKNSGKTEEYIAWQEDMERRKERKEKRKEEKRELKRKRLVEMGDWTKAIPGFENEEVPSWEHVVYSQPLFKAEIKEEGGSDTYIKEEPMSD